MPNPFKKITRLEKENTRLKAENTALKRELIHAKAVQAQAEAAVIAAGKKQLEFEKLIEEVKQSQKDYKDLIFVTRFKITDAEKKYREALKHSIHNMKDLLV